jgi:hypothetical protein
MIALFVVLGIALAWVPIGALTMRGLLLLERVDPSRKRIPKVLFGRKTGYTSDAMAYEVTYDKDDLNFLLTMWPIVIFVALPGRYALRGARWIGYQVKERYHDVPSLGHPIKWLAGIDEDSAQN